MIHLQLKKKKQNRDTNKKAPESQTCPHLRGEGMHMGVMARARHSEGVAIPFAGPVQTKVTLGQTGDRYEREADTVADRVTAGQPAPEISRIPPGGLRAQSQADEVDTTSEEQEPVLDESGDSVQEQAEARPDEENSDSDIQEKGSIQFQPDSEDTPSEEQDSQTSAQDEEDISSSQAVQQQGEDGESADTGETGSEENNIEQENEESGENSRRASEEIGCGDESGGREEESGSGGESEGSCGAAPQGGVEDQAGGSEGGEAAEQSDAEAAGEEASGETSEASSGESECNVDAQRQTDETADDDGQEGSRTPVQEQSDDSSQTPADEEPSVQQMSIQFNGEDDQDSTQVKENEEESSQTMAVQSKDDEIQEQDEEDTHGSSIAQTKSNRSRDERFRRKREAIAGRAINNRRPGEPLNAGVRTPLENALGYDLGHVRLHTGSGARDTNKELKSKAFTHKNHIWLGPGQSPTNMKLLAHEMTHVVQQGGAQNRNVSAVSAPSSTGERQNHEERGVSSTRGSNSGPGTSTALPPSINKSKAPVSPGVENTETVHKAGIALPGTSEHITSLPPQREIPAESETETSAIPDTVEEDAALSTAETVPALTGEPDDVSPFTGKETKAEAMASPEVKKASEKKPVVSPVDKAKAKEKASKEAPAVPIPENDPKYKAVIGRLEKQSRQEKSHDPAPEKVAVARVAAIPPANDRRSRAQAGQVEIMDKQEAKKTSKDDFLSLLRKALEEIAPSNMEETEEFKKKGKAGQLKTTLNKKVTQQKEDSSKDIASATAVEPDPATVEAKEVIPIPSDPANPKKRNFRSKDILPDPKPEADISAEHNKKKAEHLMAENDIDEEQLERANEPQFSDALKAKKGLDEHADQIPEAYREEEQHYLENAGEEVEAEEKSAKSAMRLKRDSSKSKVKIRQQKAKKKEEEERRKVADQIQGMYEETRKKVENKLKTLDNDVNNLFDAGEKCARDQFESYVDRRMSIYKYDRYLNKFGGGALWLKDKILGMPDEVNQFYEEGRDRYISDMDAVLVKISDTVETRLKEAKDEILNGKNKIREYIDDLPKNLKKAGREAEKNVSSQFNDLEEGVDSKKQELAQSMAKRYQESRKKLDGRIEEFKKENQGLLDAFIGKIKEIIEILRNFKNRIMSLMNQGGDAARKIVKDPGKFLDNLGAALKKGFNQFSGNFFKHLKAAFINWLFGTMSKTGIEIPSEFSFKGVFGIMLQVMGITKDWIRSRVVKHIGAKNVERIEKAWSVVSTLISGGVGGLWEKAKEFLSDLKDKLFDTIQNWLITQIVKQAILWVLSLLNPVSALLKIIKMIYDVIMFFVENIDRILQLVKAVIQSIGQIVAGNIKGAANWIENAMARILPIIISFLARLLGIGGIANKIKSFIMKVQKKVRGVIDKILKKIVGGIKKIIVKGKAVGKAAYKKGKKVAKKVKDFIFPKLPFKAGGKTQTLMVEKKGAKAKWVVKSSPGTEVQEYVWKFGPRIIGIADKKKQAEAKKEYDNNTKWLAKNAEDKLDDLFASPKEKSKKRGGITAVSKKLVASIKKLWVLLGAKRYLRAGECEMVEPYAQLPRTAGMHRNHIPQQGIMWRIKDWINTYLKRRKDRPQRHIHARATLTGLGVKYIDLGKYTKSKGICIIMEANRHKATRTYAKLPEAAELEIKRGESRDEEKQIRDQKIKDFVHTVKDEFKKDKEDVRAIYSGNRGLPKVSDPEGRVGKGIRKVTKQNKETWGNFLGG